MRRNARPPFITAAMTLGLLASLAIEQAQAHAKLVTADPAPNATVTAPKVIHLTFSEEIATKLSNFKLTDTDGSAVPMMVMQAKDAKSLDGMPNMTLSPGVYTVSWTAVSTDDGHKMTGNYSFTVK
jgi:methionine-rich copper-binding protein CopC